MHWGMNRKQVYGQIGKITLFTVAEMLTVGDEKGKNWAMWPALSFLLFTQGRLLLNKCGGAPLYFTQQMGVGERTYRKHSEICKSGSAVLEWITYFMRHGLEMRWITRRKKTQKIMNCDDQNWEEYTVNLNEERKWN